MYDVGYTMYDVNKDPSHLTSNRATTVAGGTSNRTLHVMAF